MFDTNSYFARETTYIINRMTWIQASTQRYIEKLFRKKFEYPVIIYLMYMLVSIHKCLIIYINF